MQENLKNEPRILIADDDEAFLKLTSTFLQKKGFRCECVQSADAAESMLEKTVYDLLITDIQMPGNTNLEFLRKDSFRSSFLPVIVVTGYPTLDTAVESLRLAVVDYLEKPLRLDDFWASVRSAIDKAKAIRVMREARQDFSAWMDRTSQMESALLTPHSGTIPGADIIGELDWYLGETLQRFSNVSNSLVNALQTLKKELPEGKKDVCSLMHCSRLDAYEKAVRQTVDVLIKTKNSFKSKELAEVRKKLESLLRSEAS